MKRTSTQLKMQVFTHTQKEEIYKFIQQAIGEFNSKYETELSLLKNLGTNSKIAEFLVQLKLSPRSNKREDKVLVVLKTKSKHTSRNGVIRGNTLNSLSKKSELMLIPTNQIDKHHKIHSRNIEVMPQTVIMETVDKFQPRNSMGLITNRTSNKKNDKQITKTTLSKSNYQNSKSFVVKKGDRVENMRASLLGKRKVGGNGQLYQTIPPKKSPITASAKFEMKRDLKQDSSLHNKSSKNSMVCVKRIVKESRLKANKTILENSEHEERKSFISKGDTIKKNYSKILKTTKKDSSLNETLDHNHSRQYPKRSFMNSKSYKEYATLSTSEHDKNNGSSQHKRSTLKMNNLISIEKQIEGKKVDEKTLVTKKTNPNNLNKQIKTLQNTISKNNKTFKPPATQMKKYPKNNIFSTVINEQLYQKDIKTSVKIVEALSISDEIGSLVSSATASKFRHEDDCLSRTTMPRLSDWTQTITADRLSKLPEMTLEEKKRLIDYPSKKSESKDLDRSGAEYSILSSPLKVIIGII
jgi:hypothetical protein